MLDLRIDDLLEETRKTNMIGGGAIVTYIGNLAINLLLMMDKKKYDPSLEEIANSYRLRILEISQQLGKVMQEDVDDLTKLIDAYKNNLSEKEKKERKKDARNAPLNTIRLMLEVLEMSEFFLKNGKLSTISDGKISNRLMREAIYCSIINVEINQDQKTDDFDKEKIIEKTEELFKRNEMIIQGRY